MSESKITNESQISGVALKLNNEEVVKLSLSFARLNILQKLNYDLFERFSRIANGKSESLLDLVTLIYVAYWCANYDGINKIYSEDDFIELVPFDMGEIQRVYMMLMRPKKK